MNSRFAAVVTAIVAICAPASHALVLDWSAVTWTPGTLSNSYDVDGDGINDITVTISGDTAFLRSDYNAPNAQTPALSTTLAGGSATPPLTLLLATDFTNQTQSLTITVTFSGAYTQGVTNVSFSVFDLDTDTSSFQDQLRNIRGNAVGGGFVNPVLTVGSGVQIGGPTNVNGVGGLSPDTGPGSGAGNVTISFNSPISGYSFVFGNGSSVNGDPAYQLIGIANTSFTPVPEVGSAATATGACLAFAVVHKVRRRRSRAA